jgi:hypothetical protein
MDQRIKQLRKDLGKPEGVSKVWTTQGKKMIFDYDHNGNKVFWEAKIEDGVWSYYVKARNKDSVNFVLDVVLQGELNDILMEQGELFPDGEGRWLLKDVADSDDAYDKVKNLFLASVDYMKGLVSSSNEDAVVSEETNAQSTLSLTEDQVESICEAISENKILPHLPFIIDELNDLSCDYKIHSPYYYHSNLKVGDQGMTGTVIVNMDGIHSDLNSDELRHIFDWDSVNDVQVKYSSDSGRAIIAFISNDGMLTLEEEDGTSLRIIKAIYDSFYKDVIQIFAESSIIDWTSAEEKLGFKRMTFDNWEEFADLKFDAGQEIIDSMLDGTYSIAATLGLPAHWTPAHAIVFLVRQAMLFDDNVTQDKRNLLALIMEELKGSDISIDEIWDSTDDEIVEIWNSDPTLGKYNETLKKSAIYTSEEITSEQKTYLLNKLINMVAQNDLVSAAEFRFVSFVGEMWFSGSTETIRNMITEAGMTLEE